MVKLFCSTFEYRLLNLVFHCSNGSLVVVFTGEFRKPLTAQDVTGVMRAAVSSGLVVGVTVDINSIINEGKNHRNIYVQK